MLVAISEISVWISNTVSLHDLMTFYETQASNSNGIFLNLELQHIITQVYTDIIHSEKWW